MYLLLICVDAARMWADYDVWPNDSVFACGSNWACVGEFPTRAEAEAEGERRLAELLTPGWCRGAWTNSTF